MKGVLDPVNITPWKILLTDILDDLGQDKFWYFTRKALNFLSDRFNPFWKNVVNVWATVREDPTSAPDDILSQSIWRNEKIKIGGNPICPNHLI